MCACEHMQQLCKSEISCVQCEVQVQVTQLKCLYWQEAVRIVTSEGDDRAVIPDCKYCQTGLDGLGEAILPHLICIMADGPHAYF